MKKLIPFILAISIFALAGCDLILKETVTGSAALATVSLTDAAFSRVKAADACRAVITYGSVNSASVTINENLVHYLRLEAEAGELSLSLDPSFNYRQLTFTAEITLPEIERATADDATEITITGFSNVVALDCRASDASLITLESMDAADLVLRARDASAVAGSLACQTLAVYLDDASTATLSGTAPELTLNMDDACNAYLGALATENAAVALSDACNARIHVTETLTGSVTNASQLRYAGSPLTVTVSRSDASTVTEE